MTAYLCADDNGMPMLFAKYAGTDRDVLTENQNFGYCSLIKATERILDKFSAKNHIYARVTATKREERPMVDPQALRETLINAIYTTITHTAIRRSSRCSLTELKLRHQAVCRGV